jgi:4-diphosphocytidyl-2-C-methyl-D-erythritol kinase
MVGGTTGSTSPVLEEDARAKVNLTLRVIGRRVDGYHDLESVVAFADCADRLTLDAGGDLSLTATGPRAQECGDTADNLVIKAARLLGERVEGLTFGRLLFPSPRLRGEGGADEVRDG